MADGLAEAVENAKQEIIAENTKLGVTAKEEPADDVVEEEIEDKVENEDLEDRKVSEDEDDLDEASLLEAKNLYKALRNPASSRAVLAALAEQAGLLSEQRVIKPREEAAAKKEIKQILKDALPENMQFLADQLGPAMEAVFEQHNAEVEERFKSVQLTQIEAKTTQAMRDLARATKGESVKLENKMATIAKTMPPSDSISIDEYLANLYLLAGGKMPDKGNKDDKTSRVQRNATDVSSRLKGTPGGSDKPVVQKKMTLDEAVNFGLSEIKKGKR